MVLKINVLYLSNTTKNTLFFRSNAFKEANGLLFNTLKFYFHNLTSFKNGKIGILLLDYFSNWLLFIKTIKRKKIKIAIVNLDIDTDFSLQEIGLIYILKTYRIPIIFESKRSLETINIKINYLKKTFIKMIGTSHLILPDERMTSLYTPYFRPSNIHYIALQTASITNFNTSTKEKTAMNVNIASVEFYMFINDIEQAKGILETCKKLLNLQHNFKFIFTNNNILPFLPQLNEEIRLAKLMGVVQYMTINNLNPGHSNKILIHQSQPQDNFFPQEVLNALFHGGVVIGDQKIIENGLVVADLNGSFYDPKDPASLFDQMNYYLSNPNEISAKGMEAKNTYYSYFSHLINGRKLLDLVINQIPT